MEQKLDKSKKDKFVMPIEPTSDSIEDDIESIDDEDMKFDAEGNIIFSDEDKAEIEGTDEDAEVEDDSDEESDDDLGQTESEDEPQNTVSEKKETKKSSAKASKEQLKIISMKKEMQKVQAEKRELEERLSKIDGDKKKTELISKYVSEGLDEDVAQKYAEQEIRNNQIEERLEMIDFRENNFELFQVYPQAKQDVKIIMRNAKLTGMTAEQICRAMYGEQSSYEQRIRKSMTESSQQKPQAASIETAARSATQKTVTSIAPENRQKVRALEKMINGGKPFTEEELKVALKHF